VFPSQVNGISRVIFPDPSVENLKQILIDTPTACCGAVHFSLPVLYLQGSFITRFFIPGWLVGPMPACLSQKDQIAGNLYAKITYNHLS
jgi:hypothetical protein